MAKKTYRPGRTLVIFLICIGVLYGLAALTGSWKPRLGLDLEGGTRITLTAIGEGITPTKLQQAAGIIDQRVNGSGVAEAVVTTQGNKNIIVEIPGDNSNRLVDTVKRTAQLRFRIVAGQPMPGTPVTVPEDDTATDGDAGTDGDKATDTDKAKDGDKATDTDKAKDGDKATDTDKAKDGDKADQGGEPKPRVAPRIDDETPAPSGEDTSAPAQQETPAPADNTPTQTADGASVDDALAWSQNPGSEWQQKFLEFTCATDTDESAPVADDPDQPLIACDDAGIKYLLSKAVIEGTELKTASAGIPDRGTGWAVQLSFKSSARKTFGDVSTALYNNGGQFAIVLDGVVLSAPGVNQPILDGNAEISGSFKQEEAEELANALKFGALPIRFASPPTVETVGPSLAGSQLSAGLWAGGIGLLLVMVYAILYYRGLSMVVISSLIISAAMIYAAILLLGKTAGFTLTLPGIAGLIVAVGITADSFIVYFERIRDDMREGRSMRMAVETAWTRARATVLAADAVSILAALVLYIFAIGVVRGFAFALGISTAIDLIGFFFFTKPLMSLLAKRRFFNSGHRLSGLSAETLGIDAITEHPADLVGRSA